MASKDLVLITGATGHLGFKTLLLLLQAGYRARIAVRSEAKKSTVVGNPAFQALNATPDSYEFVEVPDITAPTAYFEAIKGVQYVVHIASPLGGPEKDSTEEYRKYFIEPAVAAALGVLEAAKTEPTVKRVVITSSVAAQLSVADLGRSHGDNEWFDAEQRTVDDNGPYAASMHAYVASKIASLNAVESWMKINRPSFDLVKIHPSFLEGRNELALAPQQAFSGTNAFVLVVATGNEFPRPMMASTVHNDDVARLHVESLNSKIPAGSYIANGPLMQWEELPGLIKELFPEAVADGRLSDKGKMTGVASHFTAKKTEETFGFKLQDFRAQVKSVVGHYLELLEAPKL